MAKAYFRKGLKNTRLQRLLYKQAKDARFAKLFKECDEGLAGRQGCCRSGEYWFRENIHVRPSYTTETSLHEHFRKDRSTCYYTCSNPRVMSAVFVKVCKVVQSVLDYCHAPLKVAKLLNDMRIEHMKTELSWNPEILVSTPSCISMCLSRSVIQGKSIQNSLSMLVLDEGDLLLSFGYENDIKSLVPFLPPQCLCILMTASPRKYDRLPCFHMEQVCPEDEKVSEEIKLLFGSSEGGSSCSIAPYPFLKKEAVEALRYRAEDIGKGVTRVAIRESRAQDLRKEILNSEKLKAHFEDNPRDLELLKHDKELSKKSPPPHLRNIPDYLLDSETQKASKFIKLTQAAMTTKVQSRKKGSKRSFGKSKDPLRSLSIEKKRPRNGEFKRKGANTETRGSKKSKI